MMDNCSKAWIDRSEFGYKYAIYNYDDFTNDDNRPE